MLEEEEVGVVLRKRGRRARRYVLRSFSSDLTARVLKRCFTKRSRGTSSFNSGERVFLLRCCIMAKNGINNSVAVGIAVQSDWDNRHFSSSLTLNVRRLFEFLLQFESSTRSKLATLNEKLTVLERQLEFLEAQFSTAINPQI